MDRIGEVVNDIIRKNSNKPAIDVYDRLRERFAPASGAVIEEWCREPLRREAMKKQAKRRKALRRKCGRKGTLCRRIIKYYGPHDYHATKGWRRYSA